MNSARNPLFDKTVGILGVGALGRALVKGLLTHPINKTTKKILLSGESGNTKSYAPELVEQHKDQVELISTNQLVLQKSEIIFLCVPPSVMRPVLSSGSKDGKIKLRSDQLIISVAAIFKVTDLEELVLPAKALRTLPMVSSEFHESFTLMCFGPKSKFSNTEKTNVIEFMSTFGTTAAAKTDFEMDSLGFAGLHQKSMLAFLQSIQKTLVDQHGVSDPALAAQVVSKQMRAVCDDAVRAANTWAGEGDQKADKSEWSKIAERNSRGELNQLMCDLLSGFGFFAIYRTVLSAIGIGRYMGESPNSRGNMGVPSLALNIAPLVVVALGVALYVVYSLFAVMFASLLR